MTMSTSVDEGTALAAFLLRAYGFGNKAVYEILASRGVDLSLFQPTTGGSAPKNLGKTLFTPAARSRTGGSSNAPSWLPSGVTLGDHLSSRLGFADEFALEGFTSGVVGRIDFEPPASMGGFSRGSAQRNLTAAHWDYCGANAATAAKGDLKDLQAHDMGTAFDACIGNTDYDLTAHVLSAGATNPATTPVPPPAATPAPAPAPAPAPPAPVPSVPVDDDLPAIVVDEIEIDMTTPEEALPLPDEITEPAAATTVDRASFADLLDGLQPASGSWASTGPIGSLPDPEDAVRNLNKGTWDDRQAGTAPGIFGDTISDQKFYPAVEPVYVVIPRDYPGLRFGPMDDYSISQMVTEEASTGVSHMILALANGQRPVFRLVSKDLSTSSPYYDLVMSINASGFGTAMNCKDLEDLRIRWSDPADGTSVPEEIRFTLTAARANNGLSFRVFRDGPFYRIAGDGSAFVTMDELLMPVPGIAEERKALHDEALDPDIDLEEPGLMLLPFSDNPDMASPNLDQSQRPVYFPPNTPIGNVAKDLFLYGSPRAGMGGYDLASIDYDDLPDGRALDKSLVFPAVGAMIRTSVDQYLGDRNAGRYLSRETLDWSTDPRVYALRDDQVVSVEIDIRDGADTTAQYAGFTGDGDRRQTRIYIRGDVPERLLPVGIEPGSRLDSVRAFPMGSANPERLQLDFVSPGGSVKSIQLPDDSLKAAFVDDRGRSIVGDVLVSGNGFAEVTDNVPQSMVPVMMRQVDNDRLANRVSELNHALPVGADGLRRMVWQEGSTINILAEHPEQPERLVHLVIYPRQMVGGEGELL